jgi:hypothetical protein
MTTLRPTRDPNALLARDAEGGCLMVILVVMGLAMLAAPLLAPPAAKNDWMRYLALPGGVAFIFWGLHRRITTIDRAAGRVETYRRVIVPFHRESYAFDRFEFVELSREVRRSAKHKEGTGTPRTHYPVRLIGSGLVLPITDETSDADARRDAELLARFLRIPLHDRSEGTLVVQEVDQLDESVADRARRTGMTTQLPVQPAELGTNVEVLGDSVRLTIPPIGVTSRLLTTCISWSALSVFGLWLMYGQTANFDRALRNGERFIVVVVTLFAALAIGLSIGSLVFARWGRYVIDVSPKSLTIANRVFGRSFSRKHSADSVEEVLISTPSAAAGTAGRIGKLHELSLHPRRITIRTDGRTYRFGQHLPNVEQDYLRDLIRAVLES